jgi:hypothetical protein
MEATLKVMFDRVHGIEWRAVQRGDRGGWTAQWRPARALEAFQAFSYITRGERFNSEDEALEFVGRNAGAIVNRQI